MTSTKVDEQICMQTESTQIQVKKRERPRLILTRNPLFNSALRALQKDPNSKIKAEQDAFLRERRKSYNVSNDTDKTPEETLPTTKDSNDAPTKLSFQPLSPYLQANNDVQKRSVTNCHFETKLVNNNIQPISNFSAHSQKASFESNKDESRHELKTSGYASPYFKDKSSYVSYESSCVTHTTRDSSYKEHSSSRNFNLDKTRKTENDSSWYQKKEKESKHLEDEGIWEDSNNKQNSSEKFRSNTTTSSTVINAVELENEWNVSKKCKNEAIDLGENNKSVSEKSWCTISDIGTPDDGWGDITPVKSSTKQSSLNIRLNSSFHTTTKPGSNVTENQNADLLTKSKSTDIKVSVSNKDGGWNIAGNENHKLDKNYVPHHNSWKSEVKYPSQGSSINKDSGIKKLLDKGKTDTVVEECGWPKLDSEKDQSRSCDDDGVWGNSENSNDNRTRPMYERSANTPCHIQVNLSKLDSKLGDSINKDSGIKQHLAKGKTEAEECGWPKLDSEKDRSRSYDDDGVWDNSDMSNDNRTKPMYQRSASTQFPQHIQVNLSKLDSKLGDSINKDSDIKQHVDKGKTEVQECGWPKLDSEKDQSSNCDDDGVWGTNDISNDNRTRPMYQRSASTPFPQHIQGNFSKLGSSINKDSGIKPHLDKGKTETVVEECGWPKLDASINKDSGMNPNLDKGQKDKEVEDCGWPKLDSEKDRSRSCDDDDVWDNSDVSNDNRTRPMYQHSASTPFSRHTSNEGRNQSREKESSWYGFKSENYRNDRNVPKHSYRRLNEDGSGDYSFNLRESSAKYSYLDRIESRPSKDDSQSYVPNSQLARSKSFRDKTDYSNETSKTDKTLLKNRSFTGSQDSVHEAADSGNDNKTMPQIRKVNFDKRVRSFCKNRSENNRTMLAVCNAYLSSSTTKWNSAWREKKHSNTIVNHQADCSSIEKNTTEISREKLNNGSDSEFQTDNLSNTEDHSGKQCSKALETSDVSAIKLDNNHSKFEASHVVIPTDKIDPTTGRESLRITCNFSISQEVPEISTIKNTDEFLNSLEAYSDPLASILEASLEPDIPAPRPVSAALDDSCAAVVQKQYSETSDYTSVSDSAYDDSPSSQEALDHIPDQKQISEITSFLEEIEAEKSMPLEISQKILFDVKRIINYISLKGYYVHLYGSYLSGLAVSTSNCNLALETDSPKKNPFLHQLQKEFSKGMRNYQVEPFDEDKNPKLSKICFTEMNSGVTAELMYFGSNVSNYRKINFLLQDVCRYDKRIKTLLIATRIWAEVCLIHEPEEGKLHTLCYSLLWLHFLQNLEKPLLPADILTEKWGSKPLAIRNDSSVGELWLQFLKYYSTFDWDDKVVTINCNTEVMKSSKSWEHCLIAIEDPYSKKNIGDSVETRDCADRIFSCFKATFQYFSSPPESEDSGASDCDTNEGSQDCPSRKGTYSFNNISVDEHLPAFCERCDELNDYCGKCRPAKEIILQPLPKLSESSLSYVNKALYDVYKEYILPDHKIEGRKAFVKDLESTVQQIYPRAKLTLFGSSVNAFGFKRSDLDICMTLDRKPSTSIEKSRILMNVVRHLRKKKQTYKNVLGLCHAKIPIVKFKFIHEDWNCDLSLYNVLAVHNSSLLCKYSLLDERCRILGCALKLLAKKACLNESALHSLSSYSFVIMTIHYLQQVEPPVLPVLPLHDKKVFDETLEVPSEILKNQNYWFTEDVNALKKRYLPQPMNESSVSELWLGLLDYYTRYDGKSAITITQKEPLPSACLQRCARLFNIEDPFLAKRNLGCILNDSRAETTRKVFGRARLLFGKEVRDEKWQQDPKKYYFSSSNLSGQYMKEVECLGCGGFGHERSDCEKDNPFKKSQYKTRFLKRKPFKSKL